jgi:glycosyltransferase involved in cell wall biosynthesis
MAPRVTVCIPTYDRPQWLHTAIESVLAQTYADFVLEIHDDATPGPAVREVVESFDDPRLTLIEHESNAGIVGNFSRSLLGAETEYVLQLGDDDEMHPELLAVTVEALDSHPSAGLVHSRFDLIDADGAVLEADKVWTHQDDPPLQSGADFRRARMLYGSSLCTSTALIRRAAVPPGAFLERDFPLFDFACWLRMAKQWDIAFVSRSLARYRLHGSSHSAGVADLEGSGYTYSREAAALVHALKVRYADGDPALIRLADRGRALQALWPIRNATLPDRRLAPTARGRFRAFRAEPRLAREPDAWSLLAGAILGPRAVERLRGRA